MKPHDLALYRQPGKPAPHPDGAWAAVAISRPDVDADKYESRLWRICIDTGELTPLTFGTGDSAPAISPDGRWLAFLRTAGKSPQVFVAALTGDGVASEPRQVTDHPLGVRGALEFSDSALAYLAQVPEEGRYGTDPEVGPGKEPPRHITDFTYRRDGRGFYLDRPAHVFTIASADLAVLDDPLGDPPTAEAERPALAGSGLTPQQLTSGTDSYSAITWSGTDLLAARENRDALHDDLVRITSSGEITDIEIPHTPAPGASGTWTVHGASPDPSTGKLWLLLADYGPERMDFIGRTGALASADLDGTTLSNLTIHTDPRTDQLTNIMFHAGVDGVYVTRENRGTIELMRFDGDQLTPVLDGPVSVSAGHVLGAGGALAVASTVTSVGEVFHLGAHEPRQLTDLSQRLIAEAGVFEPEEITVTGPDGYPVHGWVTSPTGPGPHPVLLLIHGGPHAAYTPTFFDEVQVYTEAGYAVGFCNPRGSSSYGQEHGRAITGRWGTIDAQDVVAFLDGILERRADLDPGRVGVLGGSYGGYLTGWLTTQSDRWAGAIVERGFLDAFSFEGSSDIGWFFGLRYLGEDREPVASQNPMSHIERVNTPTLVIHSEEDWRCPIEQGQRWFVGLKRRGVHTEFLVFSGEGHELSRSGTPNHRIARFEHILRWWATHLPTPTNPARRES